MHGGEWRGSNSLVRQHLKYPFIGPKEVIPGRGEFVLAEWELQKPDVED